ncbi:hypothetical protein SMB83_002241 [Cronobacter sakazakii]|nr:hypothetical protein [Cronobacter sakazakii]ELY6406407.1 hypothetical protein [Cronobacter sakazakii]
MGRYLASGMLSLNIIDTPDNRFGIDYITGMMDKSMIARIEHASIIVGHARLNAGHINNQNAVTVVYWIINRIVANHMKMIAWPAWS